MALNASYGVLAAVKGCPGMPLPHVHQSTQSGFNGTCVASGTTGRLEECVDTELDTGCATECGALYSGAVSDVIHRTMLAPSAQPTGC